ncbi:MAG TPA: hypothetical protein G4O00_14125 [Thermoflexia bacterium]|jgi:hypothetical protein|nr:hypothetical protein [Thermoflexia bacterium]
MKRAKWLLRFWGILLIVMMIVVSCSLGVTGNIALEKLGAELPTDQQATRTLFLAFVLFVALTLWLFGWRGM